MREALIRLSDAANRFLFSEKRSFPLAQDNYSSSARA
jgi:hypothetical protein